MNLYSLSTYITALSTILIAVFVYLKRKKDSVNHVFFFYMLSISWWAFWSASHCLIRNQAVSLFSARIGHMTVLLIPVLFVNFLYVFLEKPEKRHLKILLFAGYFLSFFFAAFSIGTNWILESVRPKLGFSNFMEPGSLYNYLTILFGFYSTFGLFFLFKSACHSQGLKKKQLVYLSMASIIGYVFGSSNFFPIYDLSLFPFPYGSLGITGFCLLFAYAILKFRLMDIDVILKKTLIFTGLFASVMVIVSLTTTLVQNHISDSLPLSGTFATVLSVLLAMFLYDPVQGLLAHLTDRFLFQKKLSYHRLLEDASRGISKIRSLDRLAKLIVLFLVSKGKIQNAAVFIRDDESGSFRLKAKRGYSSSYCPAKLALKDVLARFLEKERKPVSYETILEKLKCASLSKREKSRWRMYLRLKREMEKLKADLLIPAFLGHTGGQERAHLMNILVLGKKKSHEAYSGEDVNIFATLARESQAAVQNARLYDEAVARKAELEAINTELEKANLKLKETQDRLVLAGKKAVLDGIAMAIGHEINNPLAILLARIEEIMKEVLPRLAMIFESRKHEEGAAEVAPLFEGIFKVIESKCETVYSYSKRIEIAVKTLTDLQKEKSEEIGPLNFKLLWKQSLETAGYSPSARSGGFACKIEDRITPDLIIRGNLGQLIQVFTNLIRNSYEAIEPGTEGLISVTAKKDKENNRMARIEFSDNGCGVPPSCRDRIWEQDFSTKETVSQRGPRGQGLYICRNIIESIHQGEIGLKDTKRKGTIFIIKLPLGDKLC